MVDMVSFKAPASAIEHADGVNFLDLMPTALMPPSSLPDQLERVIRYRADIWRMTDTGEPEQIARAEDGLNTDTLADARRAQPFFADLLSSTPRLAKRRWWVAASRIPEGTPGFEPRDHVIDLQIIDVVDPLPAPGDVAAIPADAKVTASGVGWRVLRAVEGEAPRPSLADNITVHYAGWTTDGRMFDASYLREQPNTFPLGRLIQGWQDALPLLRVGEKARIWIPGDLAYDQRPDRPFAPKGMLVFDVELLGIEPGE